MCVCALQRWCWAQVACKTPLVTNHIYLFSQALICLKHTHTHRLYVKKGLTLLLELCEEQPGRLLDRAPDLILATTRKTQKERLGGWIARDRQEKRRKKKNLVKNSQRGKSLKYSLEKPAVETSTHSNKSRAPNTASPLIVRVLGSSELPVQDLQGNKC